MRTFAARASVILVRFAAVATTGAFDVFEALPAHDFSERRSRVIAQCDVH